MTSVVQFWSRVVSRLPAKSVAKRWWRWYHHGTLKQWPSLKHRNVEIKSKDLFPWFLFWYRLWKCPWEGWNMMESRDFATKQFVQVTRGVTKFLRKFGVKIFKANTFPMLSEVPCKSRDPLGSFGCWYTPACRDPSSSDLKLVVTGYFPLVFQTFLGAINHPPFSGNPKLINTRYVSLQPIRLGFCPNLAHGNWKRYR